MKIPSKKLLGSFSDITRKIVEVRSPKAYEHLQKHCAEDLTPRDVPKGHLVVYVGQEQKRFVIQVQCLQHPLFQHLLDEAQQEYGFSPNSRLCLPCSEHLFDNILGHIVTQKNRKHCPCF